MIQHSHCWQGSGSNLKRNPYSQWFWWYLDRPSPLSTPNHFPKVTVLQHRITTCCMILQRAFLRHSQGTGQCFTLRPTQRGHAPAVRKVHCACLGLGRWGGSWCALPYRPDYCGFIPGSPRREIPTRLWASATRPAKHHLPTGQCTSPYSATGARVDGRQAPPPSPPMGSQITGSKSDR